MGPIALGAGPDLGSASLRSAEPKIHACEIVLFAPVQSDQLFLRSGDSTGGLAGRRSRIGIDDLVFARLRYVSRGGWAAICLYLVGTRSPMTRRESRFWILATVALGFAALGCESGGVGDPCIPEDEYQTDFPGYGIGEVNIESRSFQCETRLCLVNHFEGRVSCPYGQPDRRTPELVAEAAGDDRQCFIPDQQEVAANQVEVPVAPQRLYRQADDAVYCSCRCKGPDANARYCSCPDGYSCIELVGDYGLQAGGQLQGSYCVRKGTNYDPRDPYTETCSGDDCGSRNGRD